MQQLRQANRIRREMPQLRRKIFQEKLKGGLFMVRKVRDDCTVGAFERTRGLPPGTIRNPDGRDTRSDKKIGTIRREAEKKQR